MIPSMFFRSMCLAVLALAAPAAAHDVVKGPHGGRVVESGRFHLELVVADAAVDVYVSDAEEKPVAVTGFKGTAILVVDNRSQRITLAPAGDARLSGTAAAKLPAAAKGVVQVTGTDGKTVQARFN